MDNTRLGFLTPAGLIAAGLTVLIIVIISIFMGGVIFSPGALNAQPGDQVGGFRSHGEFSSQCRLCHAPFWDKGGMDARCVTCHTGITTQKTDPASLHGAIYQHNPASIQCRDCHPDHRGVSAPLTEVEALNFPHDLFGFSLTGHAENSSGDPFRCVDCHTSELTSFDPAICQTCHEGIDAPFMEEHGLAFGSDCLACHDGIDTYGSLFDHNIFPFPLTGKHSSIPCSACHVGAFSIQELRSAPLDCFSCHEEDDVHEAALGSSCETCHSTTGWVPATFDHNLSTFKLLGKHTTAACEDCHLDNLFIGTPVDCYSCHQEDDIHESALGIACESCHSAFGWVPSTFDHNLAVFKLLGKHAAVPCLQCHSDKVFRPTPTDCYSCHAEDDIHTGRFGSDCSTCHEVTGWLPATFDHNLSSFRLTGAHVGTPCESCHVGSVYRGTPSDCYSCHAGDDDHAGSYGTSCGSCHSTSAWLPASFDHNLSSFPLTGAHNGLPCAACHSSGIYNGLASACAACHADPAYHAGLFGGTACDQCHSTSSWTPASYNRSHSGDCDGPCISHEGASCRDCHPSSLTSYTCLQCHDSNNPDD